MSALPARTTAAAVGGGSRLPDLRLVPAALATWVVVLLGLYTGPAGGAVAGGLAGGALVAALRGSRRAGPAAAVVVAAGGAALAAGLVVTAHTLALHMHPLHAAAERGAAATLTVVVRDDPHALRSGDAAGRPGAAQVLVPATLRAAETGGGRWTGGGRVLLIAPAAGWSALLPGQEVGADGLLAPATRADLTVAVLRVRGAPHEAGPAPWWQTGAGALRDGLRAAAAVLPEATGRVAARAGGRRHPRPAGRSARRLPRGRSESFDGRVGQQPRDRRRHGAGAAAAAARRPPGGRRTQRGGAARLRRTGSAVTERAAGGGDGRCRVAGPRARSRTVGRAGARRGRARAAARGSGAGDRPRVRPVGVGHGGAGAGRTGVGGPDAAARRASRRSRGAGGARGGLPRDGTADRRAERRREPGGGGREPARGSRSGPGDGAGRGGRGAVPGVGDRRAGVRLARRTGRGLARRRGGPRGGGARGSGSVAGRCHRCRTARRGRARARGARPIPAGPAAAPRGGGRPAAGSRAHPGAAPRLAAAGLGRRGL